MVTDINKHNVNRYDMDHDDDVLYCYEIQTEENMRRKGLGEPDIFIALIIIQDVLIQENS